MVWRGADQLRVGDDVERGRSSRGRGWCGDGHIQYGLRMVWRGADEVGGGDGVERGR